MDVPGYLWLLTVAGIVGLLVFDFFFHVRKAHTPTLREAAVWSRCMSASPLPSGSACGCSAARRWARSISPVA